MKKVWLIMLGLVFAISACAINEIDTKEFKNPIFNQPLRPLGRTATLTYITPTSIESRTPLDKNLIDIAGNCRLLENEQNRVALFCNVNSRLNSEKLKWYIVYKIEELFMDDCLVIREMIYNKREDYIKSNFVGHTSYCVTPPQNLKLPISD